MAASDLYQMNLEMRVGGEVRNIVETKEKPPPGFLPSLLPGFEQQRMTVTVQVRSVPILPLHPCPALPLTCHASSLSITPSTRRVGCDGMGW